MHTIIQLCTYYAVYKRWSQQYLDNIFNANKTIQKNLPDFESSIIHCQCVQQQPFT